MQKCVGDTWIFIESQDDYSASTRWDIAENEEHAKKILRNILPSGNQVCDILEVKITRIYKMEPELRDINAHKKTIEWNDIPIEDGYCEDPTCPGDRFHRKSECPGFTDHTRHTLKP